jgi:serine/threonine-protein kinase
VQHVTVPSVAGLRESAAARLLARDGLKPSFTSRYASAPAGQAIAQTPAARRRVTRGSRIAVVISAGLAPVRLPSLAGESSASATAALAALGLHVRITQVPAPGTNAGTVTAQTPAGSQRVPAHSTVSLSVAQAPRWRAVTRFAGTNAGSSPGFRIQGQQWRVIYKMNYVGTCTLIVFCSGPSARVRALDTGQTTSFDLNTGSDQTQTFSSGPGQYRIEIHAGGDNASWSIEVQDYY